MMQRIKKVSIMAAALAVFLFFDVKVLAAGEWSFFGSESYEWSPDVECPIGVYVQSGDPIDTVDMVVRYDPAVLKYASGGTLEEEGIVRVKSSAGENEQFSTMLYFTPLVVGETEIEIDEVTVTYPSGDESTAYGATVPVTVAIPQDCVLKSLSVNGEALQDFDPQKTQYSMEVEADIEKLEIKAQANSDNAKVEVSDTNLKEGDNTITITSSNEDGEKMVYTLKVNRPAAQAVSQQPDEKPAATPTVTPSVEKANSDISNLILIVVCAILVILVILIVVFVVRSVSHKHRSKRDFTPKSNRASSSKPKKHIEEKNGKQKKDTAPVNKPISAKNSSPVNEDEDDCFDLDVCEDMDTLEQFEFFDNRENAIEVRNVSMCFKRQKDEASSIKEMMIQTLKGKRKSENFKALKDVSFTVKKGDVVGIIGTNGSGKSTLLKIISGVLQPTRGTVKVDRKKIQLLTLGTGFDFELTGKENVYLNGAIIGYSKEFIDEKYDEIVKFAELEGFMDEKVRNYSSGMVSRLGFAIATIRDTPEILILDEVLSVGDMFFRKKSTAKIKEMMKGGSTVLIVSHSTSVIRDNCNKAVWIEKGTLRAVGDPAEVCRMYENQKK